MRKKRIRRMKSTARSESFVGKGNRGGTLYSLVEMVGAWIGLNI